MRSVKTDRSTSPLKVILFLSRFSLVYPHPFRFGHIPLALTPATDSTSVSLSGHTGFNCVNHVLGKVLVSDILSRLDCGFNLLHPAGQRHVNFYRQAAVVTKVLSPAKPYSHSCCSIVIGSRNMVCVAGFAGHLCALLKYGADVNFAQRSTNVSLVSIRLGTCSAEMSPVCTRSSTNSRVTVGTVYSRGSTSIVSSSRTAVSRSGTFGTSSATTGSFSTRYS